MGRALDMVLAVAISVMGCGSGDDGHTLTPPEACQNFVDARCNKEAECAFPTDQARVREDCEFVFFVEFDCSTVRGIGPTYMMCLSETAQLSCGSNDPDGGLPFPDSCQGILLQ
jgi:hypothetical protein